MLGKRGKPATPKAVLNPSDVARGRRIRAARLKAELGQAEFARLLSIVPMWLYKIESGRSRPSLELLERIALALRVSMDWLNGRSPSGTKLRAAKTSKAVSRGRNIDTAPTIPAPRPEAAR